MILLYGAPAAGKLTVAKELSSLTGYTVFDNHTATDYLPLLFPRDEPKFEEVRTQLGRKIRLMLFEAVAANGVNIIATFAPIAEGRHDFIRSIKNVVEGAGGNLLLVQLHPSGEVLEQRVVGESRKGVKAETVERLHEMMEQYPAMFDTFPDYDHLTIDNSHLSPTETAKRIIEYYHL